MRSPLILGTVGLIALALLAGCGNSDSTTPERIPTRTLVPPTATPTPEPVESTPTPTDLPAAANLELGSTEVSVAAIPAAAEDLLARAIDDLADQQNVSRDEIRLISIESFIWKNSGLGCATRAGSAQPGTSRGYRILLGLDAQIFVYHADSGDTLFLCPDEHWLALEGEPLPVDPVAESMVELTMRDATQFLSVPQSRLRLVSLLGVDWPDSSIGCPKAGGVYQDQLTPGYRIVLRTREEAVIYHTSLREIVRCAPGDEILPGVLRQALPEPTPTPGG